MKNYIIGLLSGLLCVAPVIAQNRLAEPSRVQLEWQRMETTAFVHFSVNTKTDMEWGYRYESPQLINPEKLDCRQWARTCKEAGLQGVILTAKHHDGFCLWPSAYTEHSVKNSPWKNGQGDLVREFVDACREYGLKVGLYLSPWDCNHPEYGKPEYITYFCNQLRELLTNYGELYEFWFDGANGGRGYYGTDSLHTRKIPADYYPWEKITKMVYELQPNCVVHGGDLANIRWVGNEEGYALEEHWSTVREPELYDKNVQKRFQWMKGHDDGTIWMPSEVDVSVRPGWYYHASEDHKLKSLSKLTDIYYESVGRNSLLLLNLTPNKDGLIPAQDSIRLCEWHKRYTSELSNNLMSDRMRISGGKDTKRLRCLLDGNRESYWVADTKTPVVEVDFGKKLRFNRLLLQEYIEKGQRVKAFTIEYWKDGKWIVLDTQTTIGYKRILRFPEIVSSRLRICVKDSRDIPYLSEIQIYLAETVPDAPVISRNQKGEVSLTCSDSNAAIFYTLDGKEPTVSDGIQYQKPFVSDGDCIVKSIAVNGNRISTTAIRQFEGSKAIWTTIPAKAASRIFDGVEHTVWVGTNPLVVDLNAVCKLKGLTYLPDQSRWASGLVVKYVIEISKDGDQWEEAIRGEFANMQNHPVEQQILFPKVCEGRFIRFRALSTVDNSDRLGAAELNVILFK